MIKTKVIETPKGRLLVVGGLPEGYKLRIIHAPATDQTGIAYVEDDPETLLYHWEDGEFEVLGKLSDITEEQAKEVVLEYPDTPIVKGPLYLHFTGSDNIWDLDTAKESLISLVESEVPLRNKYGERRSMVSHPYMTLEEIHEEQDKWEEEQEKIFKSPVLFWEPQSKKP